MEGILGSVNFLWMFLGISAASIFGAGLRWWIVVIAGNSPFPWGVLIVNVLGSGLAGALFARSILIGSEIWQPIVLIGFLGSFTTFSSFSLDTLRLGLEGKWLFAIINFGLNNLLSLGAAGLGYWVFRKFHFL